MFCCLIIQALTSVYPKCTEGPLCRCLGSYWNSVFRSRLRIFIRLVLRTFFQIDTQAIRYLKLENTFIGVAEIRDIAAALLENTAIIIILLLFFHIITFLSSLQTLIVMNLWNNQIGDEGAEHLVNVLK